MVPEQQKSPASLPASCATLASRSKVSWSSLYTESPTVQYAIACSMLWVGTVKVSERNSLLVGKLSLIVIALQHGKLPAIYSRSLVREKFLVVDVSNGLDNGRSEITRDPAAGRGRNSEDKFTKIRTPCGNFLRSCSSSPTRVTTDWKMELVGRA
ncbi:hypothetical protein OGAPHI_001219 [Ogataea philodendri]|uniref:Uncharacterized protein n=1 Tax=Ogataea philodendri TaxID=1378263 RepID=A0A9P8PFW3_9ASCO|nr:uncharacterized protein OGAPHI_001219 [Ogataea philodendri]KAH3670704.1 hypothetical protein OGAPHI_001219 [Ogataea philodendri]